MGSITNNILLLLFFILFFQSAHPKKASVHPISSNLRCIESERKALLEFKGLVSDASSMSSWTGRDCCSWHGITCHNLTGHVRSLQLGDPLTQNFFNSSLSPWLFNFSHLEVLSLDHSSIIGPIPNMFGKLTSLIHLDLSWNSFDSAVFPDSLCSLTNLTYMDLSVTNLQGSLPFCLANLTSLTHLALASNELVGEIPGWLGNLKQLTSLDLSYNHLQSSVPSTFGNLRDLESLNLESNQLSGTLPSTFGNLIKLKDLHVNDNLLTGELSESVLEGLRSLQTLEISGNYQHLVFNVSLQWIPPFQLSSITMDSVFIGTRFPPWLQTQTNLEELTMRNAGIFGAIPDWFLTAFPNLTDIDLSDNFLNGSFPDKCQTEFPNVNSIDLSKNLLTGSIPDQCLTAFPFLHVIDLSHNSLTGSVPIFASNPPQTEHILLSGNQFSGNIPQKLCNLTFLSTLSLGNNQLIGTIPPCLGALQELSVLDLGNNSLSGHIPYQLGSLRYLVFLHLNGNRFLGELPAPLQNLTRLVTLDVGDNELQGSVPQWIGKGWPDFQYLRLESNKFSGEIPLSLCQISSLQILSLAVNNLVGTIPLCLGNLSSMLSDESGGSSETNEYIDTLLNDIKGIQREYSSSLPYAKFISLSSNHLHGEIPVELMNLKGLQSLNLSNNAFTGRIPQSIDNLSNLESLDLSMNRLSGTIPTSLANIDDLSYLNLSFNNLAGRVPSGNHFDTLNDPSIYQGNAGLCGKLLMKSCPGDDSETSTQPNRLVSNDDDDGFDQLSWMYAGIGPGLAVGFLGVIFVLYFKHPWRIAYFGFADNVYDKMRVTLCRSCFPSKFN